MMPKGLFSQPNQLKNTYKRLDVQVGKPRLESPSSVYTASTCNAGIKVKI